MGGANVKNESGTSQYKVSTSQHGIYTHHFRTLPMWRLFLVHGMPCCSPPVNSSYWILPQRPCKKHCYLWSQGRCLAVEVDLRDSRRQKLSLVFLFCLMGLTVSLSLGAHATRIFLLTFFCQRQSDFTERCDAFAGTP